MKIEKGDSFRYSIFNKEIGNFEDHTALILKVKSIKITRPNRTVSHYKCVMIDWQSEDINAVDKIIKTHRVEAIKKFIKNNEIELIKGN